MTPVFDLIYVSKDGVRTMSVGVLDADGEDLIGPFPAREAGPQIVKALFDRKSFGFASLKAAENAYVMAHFRNMSRRTNNAGQNYPWKLS